MGRKRPSDEAIQRAITAILPDLIRIIKEDKMEAVNDGEKKNPVKGSKR